MSKTEQIILLLFQLNQISVMTLDTYKLEVKKSLVVLGAVMFDLKVSCLLYHCSYHMANLYA